ncbi:MAG: peptidylprolyl isomerase [Lachnospiraceae bacterium]|nr:peptidylprolyl isomerase [Lachnospiraceae bacterium]
MKKTVSILLLLLLTFAFASCSGPEDDRTVLTIDGYQVCYDEYRYFFMNNAAALAEDGITDFSVEENLELLRSETLEMLKKNCAIRNLSKKYKFTLDKNDKAEIAAQYDEIRAGFATKEEFLEGLKQSYLTDYEFRQVQEINRQWQKLYDCMTNEANFIIQADNDTLLADIPENFYHGLQILIVNDAGENKEENRKTANEVLSKLESGEDFYTLLGKYGEDPGCANGIGYYFTSGELLRYFEDTVKSLKEGEHSGVVEGEDGYAIVLREPITDEYVTSHIEDFRVRYLARRFNEMLQEEMDSLTYKTTKLYFTLTPDAM